MSTKGRPSKLTAAVREAICKAVEVGVSPTVAAEYAGVKSSTFAGWVARGERAGKADAPYVALLEALDVAGARGRVRHTQVMDLAAIDGDWKAAAALLESRPPDEPVGGRDDVLRILSAQARAGSVPAAKVLLAEMNRREGDGADADKLDELAARRASRLAGGSAA